jgi:hypothetical protein
MDIGQKFKPYITPREQLKQNIIDYSWPGGYSVDSLVWINGFSDSSKYPSKHKTLYCSLEDRLVFSEMGIWDEDRYIKDRMWPVIDYNADLNKEDIWY